MKRFDLWKAHGTHMTVFESLDRFFHVFLSLFAYLSLLINEEGREEVMMFLEECSSFRGHFFSFLPMRDKCLEIFS